MENTEKKEQEIETIVDNTNEECPYLKEAKMLDMLSKDTGTKVQEMLEGLFTNP
ncbi:MAG: hypothetical protein ACRDDZ_05985 [Marinifilaceae bacterium]